MWNTNHSLTLRALIQRCPTCSGLKINKYKCSLNVFLIYLQRVLFCSKFMSTCKIFFPFILVCFLLFQIERTLFRVLFWMASFGNGNNTWSSDYSQPPLLRWLFTSCISHKQLRLHWFIISKGLDLFFSYLVGCIKSCCILFVCKPPA